jgi:predicted dehydrogenase
VLQYQDENPLASNDLGTRTITLIHSETSKRSTAGRPVVAFVGTGEFASKVLLPLLVTSGARLKYAVSRNGLGCAVAARKFGFEHMSSDAEAAITDTEVNTVMIATRHDTHAALACHALDMGKHVFVEKPLARNETELGEVEKTYCRAQAGTVLMVGFNRRFAPQVSRIKSLLEDVRGAKSLVMTINAGTVLHDHWVNDLEQGGARIIGEGCHFVDLARFLIGHPIVDFHAIGMRNRDIQTANDSATLMLKFADGSIGTIHYFTDGHRSFPKERLEIFASGRVLVLDNFRKLRGLGWPGFRKFDLWRQDKGHRNEILTFIDSITRGGPAPIPSEELFEVTRVTCGIVQVLGAGASESLSSR